MGYTAQQLDCLIDLLAEAVLREIRTQDVPTEPCLAMGKVEESEVTQLRLPNHAAIGDRP